MSEPLSKLLGLEPNYARRGLSSYEEGYDDGKNETIEYIDQLSPDVNKLAEILRTPISSEYNSIKDESILMAQEIINKMSKWLVKKGN